MSGSHTVFGSHFFNMAAKTETLHFILYEVLHLQIINKNSNGPALQIMANG